MSKQLKSKNIYSILKHIDFANRTRRQLTMLIASINENINKLEIGELSKRELWIYRQFIFSFIQEFYEILYDDINNKKE